MSAPKPFTRDSLKAFKFLVSLVKAEYRFAQSRTQSPRALWSAGERPRTLGTRLRFALSFHMEWT